MNKIQLRGRVGANPEIRTLNAGGKVASFRLATEESWMKDGERKSRTTWHTVETFREADIKIVEEHLSKGDLVRIDGTLRIEEWTDKEGTKRFTPKVATSDWEHGIYPDPRGVRPEKEG